MCDLNTENNIKFIRCDESITDEKKEEIIRLVNSNSWNFFYAKNTYFYVDYCINLTYTDIENFKTNDMICYENRFFVLPNTKMDEESDSGTQRVRRRMERFKKVLDTNVPEDILLVFMDLLHESSNVEAKIEKIKNIYTLKQLLFYIIPYYSSSGENITKKTIQHNNIIFFLVPFPSLEYQKINNPGDDNCHLIPENQDIVNALEELYDISDMEYYFCK